VPVVPQLVVKKPRQGTGRGIFNSSFLDGSIKERLTTLIVPDKKPANPTSNIISA